MTRVSAARGVGWALTAPACVASAASSVASVVGMAGMMRHGQTGAQPRRPGRVILRRQPKDPHRPDREASLYRDNEILGCRPQDDRPQRKGRAPITHTPSFRFAAPAVLAGESGASVNRASPRTSDPGRHCPCPAPRPARGCRRLRRIASRKADLGARLRVAPDNVVSNHDLRHRRDQRPTPTPHCSSIRSVGAGNTVVHDRVVLYQRAEPIAQRADEPEPPTAEVLAAAVVRQ